MVVLRPFLQNERSLARRSRSVSHFVMLSWLKVMHTITRPHTLSQPRLKLASRRSVFGPATAAPADRMQPCPICAQAAHTTRYAGNRADGINRKCTAGLVWKEVSSSLSKRGGTVPPPAHVRLSSQSHEIESAMKLQQRHCLLSVRQ